MSHELLIHSYFYKNASTDNSFLGKLQKCTYTIHSSFQLKGSKAQTTFISH